MQIIILGCANAVPMNGFENTHFLVSQAGRAILVDCASNPMLQVPKSGVPFDQIEELILTHFHPDHVSGGPLLLMGMWLLGRKKKLRIHGLKVTLDRFETMLNLFDYQNWPGFYELEFNRLGEEEKALVLEDDSLRILSSPVDHLIPNIGLRFESLLNGRSLAYSSDTAPSERVVRLAQGCDTLFHEASGDSKGHSSASDAAAVAQQAGAGSLYLIHYPPQQEKFEVMLQEARKVFPGRVELAMDLMRIKL